MAINFPQFVYKPVFATFARPVTISPVASQRFRHTRMSWRSEFGLIVR